MSEKKKNYRKSKNFYGTEYMRAERGTELVKKKLKKKKRKEYEIIKCQYIRKNGKPCKRVAIGIGTLCAKHGGIISELNLIQDGQIILAGNSKYKPEFHPLEYIRLAKLGMSNAEIAAEFLITEMTLTSWSEKYATFNTAYEIGKALHESFYLKMAKTNMKNPVFQTPLFKFVTMNKLGYSDKVESRNLNANFGVLMVPGKMSEEEWENGDFTDVK